MKNKGFTLIELLAVIILLGIIALIAIPIVNKMIKESKSLTTGSNRCIRLGVILNIKEDDKDSIDWSFTTIKSQFAEIGEIFLHVQDSLDETRQIIVIECGMEMPIKFIQGTYEKFKSRMDNKAKEVNFASTMNNIKVSNDSLDFDNAMSMNPGMSNSDFLKKLKNKNNTSSDDKPSKKNPIEKY